MAFAKKLLAKDPAQHPTAAEALCDSWFSDSAGLAAPIVPAASAALY